MNLPPPTPFAPSNTPTAPIRGPIPEGYLRVESKLDGVTVYAPAPPTIAPTERSTNFKCPNCGATTAFDPRAGSVTCSNCGSVYAIRAQQVGHQASEFEFTLDTLNSAPRGWGSTRRDLHCENCGATISVAPTELSNTCPFCGSNRVAARAAVPDTFRPRFLIPFRIERDDCPGRAREWLKHGWLYPRRLVQAARGLEYTGIYLPFWTFSAQVNSEWRAEVGHEREERYFDVDSLKFNTRTVIDWKWETGNTTVPFSDTLGTATKHVPGYLLSKIEPFYLDGLVTYDPGYLAGWRAQSYEIPLNTAWDVARRQMRETALETSGKQIDSKHVRNFSMNAAFDAEAWRLILLPVFLATYRFEGKTYQLVINGQTGKVAGETPVDWVRVWLAVAVLVSPGLLLGIVGLFLKLLGGNSTGLVILGVILFLIGALFASLLLRGVMRAEKARPS